MLRASRYSLTMLPVCMMKFSTLRSFLFEVGYFDYGYFAYGVGVVCVVVAAWLDDEAIALGKVDRPPRRVVGQPAAPWGRDHRDIGQGWGASEFGHSVDETVAVAQMVLRREHGRTAGCGKLGVVEVYEQFQSLLLGFLFDFKFNQYGKNYQYIEVSKLL